MIQPTCKIHPPVEHSFSTSQSQAAWNPPAAQSGQVRTGAAQPDQTRCWRGTTRAALLLTGVLLTLGGCAGLDSGSATPTAQATAMELPEGVRLIEEYNGEGDEIAIPFAKYQLDNGLIIILHEDHSDPLVHVDVSYHVGSNREEPGRSGFAHFFEHMMFEGSANVAEGDHSRIITNAGGTLNGSTDSDRTNYYQTLPANQLEVALWLEADRMGFLLEAVDQEKFEVQRETVKNERGQRVDNVPYGRASETMMQNLYPADHPYSWPVIGWTEDLDAATLKDLERFFLRWYGPNNAQITIGGDIDRQQTLQWIAKYFGPIPSGPEVEPMAKQPGQLEASRYVTLEDNIHLPAIAMLFPTVYAYHPDEAPLDAAAKVLGQGRASLLYQRLVQSGRAVSAYVSHACRELACEMAFIIVQNPASGETLAEMEAAVWETIAEFAERGVSEDDLQKFKAQFESSMVFGMESVAGKVGALAYSEMFLGDPRAAQNDLQRYRAVTADQAVDAFQRLVMDRPAVVVSIVPQGRADLAARAPNYTTPTRNIAGNSAEAPPQLRSVADDFDRSRQPGAGVAPVVQLPPVWQAELANGIPVLGVSNTETPTVSLQLVFDVGSRDEKPELAGLSNLTATLMNEATQQRSAAEFAEALERLGSAISISSGTYESAATLSSLERNLDASIELLLERLLQPAFLEDDFERIRTRNLEALQQAQKSGPTLAARAVDAVLNPPNTSLALPGSGLPETLQAIGLEDVRAFHASHLPKRLKGVLVSSSLDRDSTLAALASIGQLPIEPIQREALPPAPAIDGQTLFLVHREDAAQSSVRIAHPALPYDALGDFYRAGLMNFNLGGDFDSRINSLLREDKGWTYGAYSSFLGGPELGRFQFSAEINREATADAIRAALEIIETYAQEGMGDSEYVYLQNAIGQRDALRYETPGAKLGLLGNVLSYDLPLDYRQQQQQILRQASREDLNRLAADLLRPEDVAIIIAGDLDELRPQIESLGLPVRVLDADGIRPVE